MNIRVQVAAAVSFALLLCGIITYAGFQNDKALY